MTDQSAADPSRRRPAGCLSDFAMERLFHGELDGGDEGRRARVHVDGCAGCGARWAALRAVAAPPLDMAPLTRTAKRNPRRAWPAISAVAVAAAATLGMFLLLRPAPAIFERTKGGDWQLGVIALRPDGKTARLDPGATLRPGDRIQFDITAPAAAFVAIVDLDARGAVTPFYPTGGRAIAVAAGSRHRSASSILLDDAVGPERMVLVACTAQLSLAEIVRVAAQDLARAGGDPRQVTRLGLPCAQQVFPIVKVPR